MKDRRKAFFERFLASWRPGGSILLISTSIIVQLDAALGLHLSLTMAKLKLAESKIDPASVKAARQAGLRYLLDDTAGIQRVGSASRGFSYRTSSGNAVRDKATLGRIRSLVLPPAWKNVWISPHANGHLQATGTDARGRKQYRYHPRWQETRDESKYSRILSFAQALPKIRRITNRHLKLPGLPREKVLAAVVQIMERTLIRVGNDEYARTNDSYGLTTLQDKHADVKRAKVTFDFKGKSGIAHEIDLEDPKLAKIVRECQDLPGKELFQYVDADGKVCDIGSSDVNAYLQSIAGEEFTAKDFRTWAGTVLAARALQEMQKVDTATAAKKNVVQAIESVAKRLGNTRAVCRKCYIHPKIIDSYMDGQLIDALSRRATSELRKNLHGLPAEEAAVLALLQRSLVARHRKAS